MNLKAFRNDISNLDAGGENHSDSQVSASMYREEINTLNIDKLSNRVTIISVIIPCLIGAILVFAYLDIKERVVDVDITKQSQVDKISNQLEEKLNALDVKIAKNRFSLENKFPEFENKSRALEDQITKLKKSKGDNETINAKFDKITKQVSNNASQNKKNLTTFEKINEQNLSAFKKEKAELTKIAQQIKKETALFKKELNAQFMELSDDDQQIGELRKDFSLMNKKFKNLERESASQAGVDKKMVQIEDDISNRLNILDGQIKTLNQKLEANISRLQKNIDQLSNGSSKSTKPKPVINIAPSKSTTIKEKPLTQ